MFQNDAKSLFFFAPSAPSEPKSNLGILRGSLVFRLSAIAGLTNVSEKDPMKTSCRANVECSSSGSSDVNPRPYTCNKHYISSFVTQQAIATVMFHRKRDKVTK